MSLGLGVVGAGGFAEFVTDSVTSLGEVRVVAVTDTDPDRAAALAARHGGEAVADIAVLLADDRVDVVVITTPPSTHAALAIAALDAGRHVFCEKPLATSAADARAVVAAAERAGRVVVVDHVLRHNPILAAVVRLQEAVLGPPRRFLFENDASDERLGPDHWFWNDQVSGGILLEHAVHAFDAATWLLGSRPSSVQTTTARRADEHGHDAGLVDLVSSTALHPGGAIATHTHSFTHADRCERQLMRLDHGVAETVIEGWIPVDAHIDLWTDDAGVEIVLGLVDDVDSLMAVGPTRPAENGSSATRTATATVHRDAGAPAARGRGQGLTIPHRVRIELSLGGPAAKQAVYAAGVRSAMTDLVRCIRSGEPPISGAVDAAGAVIVAAGAQRAARTGTTVSLLVPPPPRLAPTAPSPASSGDAVDRPPGPTAKERS